MKPPCSVLLLLAAALLAVLAAMRPAGGAEPAAPEELAPSMGRLQLYAAKLGCSIAARNERLALFYAAEVDETAGEMRKELPVHDGLPLDHTAKTIFVPVHVLEPEGPPPWPQDFSPRPR